MSDETKITLKVGVIASAIASLIVLVFGCLWSHHTEIVVLKTNYVHVTSKLDKIENIVTEIRNIKDDMRTRAKANCEKNH